MKKRYYVIIISVVVFSASAFFYLSYAYNLKRQEALKILSTYFKPEFKAITRNYTKKDIIKYKKEAATGNASAEFNLGNAMPTVEE